MTFVLEGLRRSGNFLLKRELTRKGNVHAPQALFPLRRRLLLVRGLLRKSCTLGLLLLPYLQEGRLRRGGLGMHLVLRPVRLPPLPLDLGPARGVEVSLVARLVRASVLLSLLLLREVEGGLLVRSGRPLLALLPRWPLPAHHCMLCDVVSRESLPWSAPVRDPLVFPDLRIEEQGRIVELALGRAAPVAGLSDLALAPLSACGQAVERVVAGTRLGRCPPACGRGVTGRGVLTAISRVAFALAWCLSEIGRNLRTATAVVGITLSMTDLDLWIATGLGGSVRDPLLVGEVPPRRSRDRSRSREQSLLSSDRSRSKESSRRARREQLEGGKTVTVSQAPVVSEASATVAPPVVGGTVTALPSAVQDLAKFFLSLTGSSSQGAVGSVASATVPTSGASAPGVGAVASCVTTATSSVADRPSVSAAVPGSSGHQQREEELSRCSRRRRRSSSGGTGCTSKKCPRERSPSPGRSSRRWEESY